MNKLKIYQKYFYDYIKHREFRFIISAVNYILFKYPGRKTTLIRSQSGIFLSRKGTIDFQFANHAYEWNVKQFILDHYKDYNVFFDVGSNIGTYAILMAKAGMKVIAFEPINENYKAIIINTHLNNLENEISIFNFGLGKNNQTADFTYNPVNTGASHYSHSVNGKGIKTTSKIKSLDTIYKDLGLNKTDKILMKVDVEGMEAEVFEGASEFLGFFPNLFLIFESKLSGLDKVRTVLSKIGEFEYITIDKYNTAARKIVK